MLKGGYGEPVNLSYKFGESQGVSSTVWQSWEELSGWQLRSRTMSNRLSETFQKHCMALSASISEKNCYAYILFPSYV